MGQGNEKGTKSRIRRWLLWSAIVVCVAWLGSYVIEVVRNEMTAVQLLANLDRSKRIYAVAQAVVLHHATTGIGKGGFPADVGVKTNLEYVRYLIEAGSIPNGDLWAFCKSGHEKSSASELRAEDIAFRFANVSVNDPPETIFCVSYNVLEEKATRKWWEFYKASGYSEPLDRGFIVTRLDGTGYYYTNLSLNPKVITPLPPREPKFLDP